MRDSGKVTDSHMKKRRCIFLALMIVLCGMPAFADVTPAKFYEANLAYKNQEFYKAIDLYNAVLSEGKESGPAYYNLGNAYFRVGDIGRAVLSYERAMRFIPRDNDLRANRGYVLSLVEQPDIEKKLSLGSLAFDKHFIFFTQAELGHIVIVLLILLIAGHLCGLWLGWPVRKIIFYVVVLGCLLAFYLSGFLSRTKYDETQAVMLTESSALFEPREGSTEYYRVYAGNTVTYIRRDGMFVKVKRSDGKAGWVKAESVGKIMPGRDEFNERLKENAL